MSDPKAAIPKTALITGASSGLGAEFAHQLARAKYRLVLVARDSQRLDAMRDSLLAAGAAAVEVLAADLTDDAARAAVSERLTDTASPVDLLVNNAGIGLGRTFDQVTPDDLRQQLELNCTAVLLLTRAAVPSMVSRGSGAIINVASVAGLFPNPGASYAGTKAWVVAFSEGLAMSLKGTGVQVQALCPGLIRTEFHPRAGIDLGRTPGFSFLDVQQVVATSLADLQRGRVVSVPGALYKSIVVITKLLPRRVSRALAARVYAARG